MIVSGINGDNLDSVKKMEEDYLLFNRKHELVSSIVGFHAEYTSSKRLINAIAETAYRHKAPVFTRNYESRQEVEDCIKRTSLWHQLNI